MHCTAGMMYMCTTPTIEPGILKEQLHVIVFIFTNSLHKNMKTNYFGGGLEFPGILWGKMFF